MIRSLSCIGACILTTLGFAQWVQRADFGGTARLGAVAFSIGSKAYVGLGDVSTSGTGLQNDLWEYDPATDAWAQRTPFPGGPRFYAIAFAVGGKGYVGTGGVGINSTTQDIWAYDPTTDTWEQKANYGGGMTSSAVAFTIGDKGYLATGFDDELDNKQDLWEYDPAMDTWTQKADLANGPRNLAVGFAIGDTGYVCTGFNLGNLSDLWAYDPVTDAWSQRASFPGTARRVATAFVLNGKGFVGTGFDGARTQDFHAYDPATGTWAAVPDLGGVARTAATAFTVASRGYVATGAGNPNRRDLWEYVEGPTDVNVPLQSRGPVLWPNPSNGRLFLHADATTTELLLHDLAGALVFRAWLNGPTDAVDVSVLPAGLYTATMTTGDRRQVQRVVLTEQ